MWLEQLVDYKGLITTLLGALLTGIAAVLYRHFRSLKDRPIQYDLHEDVGDVMRFGVRARKLMSKGENSPIQVIFSEKPLTRNLSSVGLRLTNLGSVELKPDFLAESPVVCSFNKKAGVEILRVDCDSPVFDPQISETKKNSVSITLKPDQTLEAGQSARFTIYFTGDRSPYPTITCQKPVLRRPLVFSHITRFVLVNVVFFLILCGGIYLIDWVILEIKSGQSGFGISEVINILLAGIVIWLVFKYKK